MKIVHVTETLKGGVGSYIRTLAKHQQHAPEISRLRFILPFSVDWLPASDVYTVPTGRNVRQLLAYARNVAKIISMEQPSIIHVHSSIAGALVRLCSILGLFPKGIKIVYCSHGWAFDQHGSTLKNMAYAAIERALSIKSDATICISPYEKRIAERIGIHGCICIPNGVDPDANGASYFASGSAEQRTLLFVGRLDKQKGIDLLLKSYANVAPRFKLVVVGGESRGDLLVERPDFVEFRGWLDGDELAQAYRSCDALIVPSRWEGFGLVAIEAMARGKPVFAADVGGLRDVISHQETGWLFDLKQLDQTLRDIDAMPDEDLRAMGMRARQVFDRQFTASRMNSEIIDVYASVLAQEKRVFGPA
jgi:glycosyltransferase involved in cell wall biosynthesis